MKIVYRNKLIIGILLILAVSQISAVRVQPRRARQASSEEDNALDLPHIVRNIGELPVAGPILVKVIESFMKLVETINQLTNGVFARLLGGALPCELSRDGFVCSGISEKGGVYGMFESAVDELPLPQVVKEVILMAIKTFVNPAVDTLFGGVPSSQSG